jgi:hypothetical protein
MPEFHGVELVASLLCLQTVHRSAVIPASYDWWRDDAWWRSPAEHVAKLSGWSAKMWPSWSSGFRAEHLKNLFAP